MLNDNVKTKKKNRLKILLLIVLVIVVVLVITCAVYIGKYYHANVNVEDYKAGYGIQESLEEPVVYQMGQDIGEGHMVDGLYVHNPENNFENLVIFYPGAKVEYTAYLPLFYELAAQGVDSYIVKMPGNLAFFGVNKAEKIMEMYDYDSYYLAGHSLGGAMGASFASDHLDALDGMIFLASYPTKSLAAEDFEVLSIYGSEDTVLNMEKVVEGRQYMPEAYTEICIEGGNHAQFGDYGFQKGDQPAFIEREEQQKQTVEAMLALIEE
ncbi:MAG: alpha/beta hydrolase [Eubacterium sp.]|nr:alpha/beta hydrolase [Eubacterium sp.]